MKKVHLTNMNPMYETVCLNDGSYESGIRTVTRMLPEGTIPMNNANIR